MYSYIWDTETGGLLLNSSPLSSSKEPRPVYYKELDILGFNHIWNYDKDDTYPYMWAEGNNYFYRGRLVAKTKGGALYTAPEIIPVEDPEPNGQPLRFVNIQAMVEKNHGIIETLAQNTIKKIYNTYVKYKSKVDVFYVAFSGGKDSIVALDLVQRTLPHNEFKVLFGDTGMEFPDTYDTVELIESECGENGIEFLRAKSEFDPSYTWRQFGPPAQTMRWCCSVHKTSPQIILLRKITNNPHFRGMAFTGIRRDESASRSEYEDVSIGEKVCGQYSCHPILEWNSAELFVYIFSHNLLINNAYKKGNSRAGCLVCPLAGYKNAYMKEMSYGSRCNTYPSTTTFNDIILETTSKELLTKDSIQEFMNIGGWKARRSGRELSFSKNVCIDSYDDGVLTIRLLRQNTDWHEWIKTVGEIAYLENGDVEVIYDGKPYVIRINKKDDSETEITVNIGTNTKSDIYFMSAIKTVFRKTAYCVGCGVCEANCPNGFIHMKNGVVSIDDRCIKCKKCHEIAHGCLVSNSLRLPKGERKMGSIDRYGNMGIEYEWVCAYFREKDNFWASPHGLGTNMVKNLKKFLNDSEITEKNKFADFGKFIGKIGIENVKAWALMLCNLAYTSEFNWWIKNINFSYKYTPEVIYSMLNDTMSKNTRSHIVSAYKNIFISIGQVGNEIGMGKCDYELKNGKRFWNSVVREPWQSPDPIVILYSLYKFAEACGGYYQFTLNRLLSHDIESDGVSPAEIFGLNRDHMEKILNSLSVKSPDFITISFTLDLDNITLNAGKTSKDVLSLL